MNLNASRIMNININTNMNMDMNMNIDLPLDVGIQYTHMNLSYVCIYKRTYMKKKEKYMK